jgi:hypothetical protein
MEDDLRFVYKWKTTWILSTYVRKQANTCLIHSNKLLTFQALIPKMEDDLSILANGRLPQYFGAWKTTSTFLSIEDDLNFFYMEDDLRFFGIWKTTSIFVQLFYKWETTSIVLQMKDNLKWVRRLKMTSDSFVNGRGPESWETGNFWMAG